MEIVLERVELDKKDVLYRLLQYSLFEESLNDGNCIGEDGLYSYPWFENYFSDADREACFIREQKTGKLLGFVMINEYMQKTETGHSIAEFMVLPNYRRCKVGKQAAICCFDKYEGAWEVSPSKGSEQAYLFWRHVIDEYTDKKNLYEDGIFLFER